MPWFWLSLLLRSGVILLAGSKVERGLILNLEANPLPASYPPKEDHPNQVRVGGMEQEAKLIRKVQPVYPASAKATGLQGTVELEMAISKDGAPEDIRVLSSPGDDLTQSALDAVRQWRYNATLLNGQPVEVVTEVIVNYTLAK